MSELKFILQRVTGQFYIIMVDHLGYRASIHVKVEIVNTHLTPPNLRY